MGPIHEGSLHAKTIWEINQCNDKKNLSMELIAESFKYTVILNIKYKITNILIFLKKI